MPIHQTNCIASRQRVKLSRFTPMRRISKGNALRARFTCSAVTIRTSCEIAWSSASRSLIWRCCQKKRQVSIESRERNMSEEDRIKEVVETMQTIKTVAELDELSESARAVRHDQARTEAEKLPE